MIFRRLLLLCVLMAGAHAQALTTIEFITPDGNAGPNDVIEVWLRISTDTGFSFDASDPDDDNSYGGSIDPLDVPTGGYSPDANEGMGGFIDFEEIDSVYGSIGYTCGGTFTGDGVGSCTTGANYDFTFGGVAGDWAAGGSFDLAAGDSFDFLFGSFAPTAGGAAPGTYNFYRASILLVFQGYGFDDFGEEFFINGFYSIASTCANDDMSCDFTRTVVPVPAAAWLFMSGLLGLFGMGARRKATV